MLCVGNMTFQIMATWLYHGVQNVHLEKVFCWWDGILHCTRAAFSAPSPCRLSWGFLCLSVSAPEFCWNLLLSLCNSFLNLCILNLFPLILEWSEEAAHLCSVYLFNRKTVFSFNFVVFICSSKIKVFLLPNVMFSFLCGFYAKVRITTLEK